ncbi:tetratricopeptide repeat protein [Priestia sp. YIM B13486]|uniref:tetratricopeptide repeat protein n=1 Tax=Priestia sp. YIM B13486 TaxID=3366304 RepID=UPI00366DC0BE
MEKHSKVIQKMAQVIPFSQTGDFYFEKALQAFEEEESDKALKYLTRANKENARNPQLLTNVGVALTEQGDYQDANELFLHVIHHMDDALGSCYYYIANSYAHLGLFEESKKYAMYYIEHFPNGDLFRSATDLLDLLSIDVDEEDEEPKNQLGDMLIIKQEQAKRLLEATNFEEAVDLLTEIIDEYPEFWSAYNNLALAYFYLNKIDEAMDLLNEVLEKNPGNLHALCNQLIFYYYCHKHKEVEELTDGLSRVYPMSFEHRYKLGATFALIGQYKLSYRWLKKLYTQGFQGDNSFHYWLSYASYYTGREAFAKEMWKLALEDVPDKEGEEPWRISQKAAKVFQSKVDVTAKKKCATKNVHDQLYSLYMAKKLPEQQRLLLLEEIKSSIHMSTLLDEVYTYVWQDKQHVIFEVADVIELEMESHNESDTQDLLSFWFYVYVQVYKQSYDFQHVNVNAWAAAVTYIWAKEQNQSITQADAAKQYSISAATVRKYSKIVNTLLN